MPPKIIHMIWDGDHPNIDRFRRLNPDHGVMVHASESWPVFPAWQDAYDACELMCQRVDLVRYSVLRLYGGWYFDVDVYPLKPLSALAERCGLDGATHLLAGPGPIHPVLDPYLLACPTAFDAWEVFDGYIASVEDLSLGVVFGPKLLTRMQIEHPTHFKTAEARYVSVSPAPILDRQLYLRLMEAVPLPPEMDRLCLVHGATHVGWRPVGSSPDDAPAAERWSDQQFKEALERQAAIAAAGAEAARSDRRLRQCKRCEDDACAMKRHTGCERKARLKRPNFHCPAGRF